MNVVGFDFGTTNSLVSVIRGDRVIHFVDDLGLPIPSVVCYEAGRAIIGREAKERLATAGLGVYGNIVRSPKVLLGQESVFVDGVERSVIDVVADLIKGVRHEALSSPSRELSELDVAVVTIPVNFEGQRRAALRDACRIAGLRILRFVHEPLAALYGFLRSSEDYAEVLRHYDRQMILVFDWGGGTLDLTLCRIDNGTLLQVANDGTDEVGGDLFDDAIRHEVVRRVHEARGYNDQTLSHPDAAARLLHRCERAKIDLSTRERIEVYVDHFFRGVEDDSLEYTLTRSSLEQLAQPLIDAGIDRIRSLLEAAQVAPAQVALCLATGGMVNMPVIRARLHELFGPQRVHVVGDGGSATAEGAAWIAHDGADLRLAKNVELMLARNAYFPLIMAGTAMPSEREVRQASCQLYCVDPRDGFGKVQLVAPRRPGARIVPNDRRVPLATMGVEVHAGARPFLERIELDAEIDDNLILHCRAKSMMAKATAEVQVHTLEFGVAVGEHRQGENVPSDESPAPVDTDDHVEKGAVTVRANLANQKDDALVPGEVLYKHHPGYFDSRLNPPRIQVEERLYYEPCARCGRASNDPLCKCGSRRP